MSNITSPLAVAVAGGILSYRITANNSPFSYGATNLPGGLALYKGGILAGQILPGTYQIGVTATNATGDTASGTLTITVADDRIGTTPPIFADAAFRVQAINADGTPASGGVGGSSSSSGSSAAATVLTRVSSAQYEASHILKAGAGALVSLEIYNHSAGALFIMLFDAAAVPANGVANWVRIIPIPAGGFAALDLPFERYSAGIVVCNSTSDTSFVPGGSNCWFTANVL